MTGILSVILKLTLQFWCADPLYLPVTGQWSRTVVSPTYSLSHLMAFSKSSLSAVVRTMS